MWDEFGRYGAFQDKELLSEGLQSVLQEATKHGYFPVLIAHGDQAKWFPGVAGLFATLKQGTVKVESIGEPANDFGEMKPTGRYRVTDLEGNTAEFAVPPWLTEEYLLGIVRSRRPQSPAPLPEPETVAPRPTAQTATQASPPPPPTKLYQSGESDRETLEKLLSLPAEFAEIPESEKVESVAPGSTLDDVESYVKERGECPESAVKNWGKTRRKGTLTSSEVEDLLIELVSFGRLESFTPPSGKGRWVRWIGSR